MLKEMLEPLIDDIDRNDHTTTLQASLNPRHLVLLLRSKLRLKITLVRKGQL
jgi:hypothetical protein